MKNSVRWPIIAIVRQNVMALIVPPSAATKKKDSDSGAAATTSANGTKSAGTKSAGSKSAAAKKTTKTVKSDSDNSDTSDDSSDSNKFGKVTQLSGKRVGIVTGNEATTGLLELVLSHYGVPLDKVTISQIDPGKLADAVKSDQVDALFVAGAATGRAISDAVAAATVNGVAPTFIEIDQADGIAKRNPAFDSVDIDAGTFGGNPPTPDDNLKSF